MQNKHGNKKRNNEADDKNVNNIFDANAANDETDHNKTYEIKHSDIFGR